MPRARRRLTAKQGFTAWALVVYAFLYLPILVMAVFAFNKPSAACPCRLPRLQRLQHPAHTGRQHHGLERVHRMLVQRRAARPDLHPGDRHQPPDRRGSGDHLYRAGAVRGPGPGPDEAAAPGAVRHPRLPDPGSARDSHRGGLPHLLRAGAQLLPRLPGAGQEHHPAGPGGVQRLGGDAHHPGQVRGDGRHARRGRLRPRLRADGHLPPGDAAAALPAIVAAALLSFTFSFDDYVIPAFTNGTTNTWPIVLYSAVRFGLTPSVNALATIMLAITVLAVIVTAIVLRRSRVRATPGPEAMPGLDIGLGLR